MSSPCRVCARVHLESNGLNLFRKTNKNVNTLARLNKIVGIVLKQRKNMPDYICAECIIRLTQAFEFRLQCRRSQALLHRPAEIKIHQGRKDGGKVSWWGNNSDYSIDNESENKFKTRTAGHYNDQVQGTEICVTQNPGPFESVKFERDYLTDDETLNNLKTPKIGARPEEQVKDGRMPVTVKPGLFESVRIVPKIDTNINYKLSGEDQIADEIPISIKAINKCSKTDKADDADSFHSKKQTISQYTDDTWLVNSDVIKVSDSKSGESDPKPESDEECKTVKTTEQYKFDIGNPEKPARFVCEMCGQTFNVQHYFNSHVNRHKGEQTFACEICPERYYSQQSLKRHMLKHAGAQPNACRFCPRRFLDCSAKVRHERMHTNNRPYKCTYCEKAFTSNYVLKNHVLTHTGERPFSCKICQRSFTQKKHLAAHYKSTTHKQNEEKANTLGMQANKDS